MFLASIAIFNTLLLLALLFLLRGLACRNTALFTHQAVQRLYVHSLQTRRLVRSPAHEKLSLRRLEREGIGKFPFIILDVLLQGVMIAPTTLFDVIHDRGRR